MLAGMGASPEQAYLQNLVETERPARMVGIFTARQMKPHDLTRLTEACQNAMRAEDGGAAHAER